MTVRVYECEKVTFELGGKPFGDALSIGCDNVSLKTKPCTLETEMRVSDAGWVDFEALMERFAPVEPSGVVTLSIPFGILGTIRVNVLVQGVTHKGGVEQKTSTTFDGAIDPNALRAAVANAVRNAVLFGFTNGRNGTSVAIRAWQLGATDTDREMGIKIAYGRGCAYHGKRKRQKAMRRLLRAAGVTTHPPPFASSAPASKGSSRGALSGSATG